VRAVACRSGFAGLVFKKQLKGSSSLNSNHSASQDRLYQRLSIVLFAVLSFVVLLTFRDYGVSWDEQLQSGMGENVLRYFTSHFHDRTALDMGDLNNYGGFFEVMGAIATRVLPFGLYESRHLLTAICGVLGILAVWKIGRFLAGPGAAFWAATLLTLYPPYYGHMFINSKDIPFAALYAWSLYYLIRMLRELPNVAWKTAGKFAVASGLTMAIRVGGLIVVCYLVLFTGIWFVYSLFFQKETIRYNASFLFRKFAFIPVVAVAAYAIMLAFWPYGSSKPFVRPFTALHWLSHVTANVSEWDYIPRHLAFKLPEIVLLFIVVGVCIGLRELLRLRTSSSFQMRIPYLLLVFSALFPVGYAIYVGPYLYDEIRHFLFIIPPLICIAALALNWTLERLLTKRIVGRFALAALVVYLILQVRIMWMLHPYEYTYFNRLIGGIDGASKNGYEAEYWTTSYKEGVEKLQRYLLERDGAAFERKQYRILLGRADWCATYYFPQNFTSVVEPSEADIYLSTTRYGGDADHAGTVVIDVQRFGVPFLVAKIMTSKPREK
jgi:hypothetical protein